jgi:hypothetical protein
MYINSIVVMRTQSAHLKYECTRNEIIGSKSHKIALNTNNLRSQNLAVP